MLNTLVCVDIPCPKLHLAHTCLVRRGGKLLCVGSIDPENTVYMKIGTRKRLSYIFTYGGQVEDLKEVLSLISKGVIRPQVKKGKLEDFPNVLQDLVDGKVDCRVALMHEDSGV
jgi:propanol-preferring alcohol dehydrogenase